VIKAQRYRTQEKNRDDALRRLQMLIRGVAVPTRKRIATKPTRSSQQRRLDAKARRARLKSSRQKVRDTSDG
jgi:ribosome-associated protein